jgi:hypothetical protein
MSVYDPRQSETASNRAMAVVVMAGMGVCSKAMIIAPVPAQVRA